MTTSALVTGTGVSAQTTLPQGGTVIAGSAVIASNGAGNATITQNSARAIVNWDSFSVGQGNAVHFDQPSAQAAILNRVTGTTTSQIAGSITGNGQIYLVNANGIAITATGSVDVGGGFVASSLDIGDGDFLSGKLDFRSNGTSGLVGNAGMLAVGSGGFAALLGGRVANSGLISVPLGKIGLGSGEAATLDFTGDGFLQLALPSNAAGDDPLVTAGGRMTGAQVVVRAASLAGAVRAAVAVPGALAAQGAHREGGEIVIDGGEGAALVTGQLDVSGTDAPGGSIGIGGSSIALQGAALSATGASGGTIAIGGGDHGRPLPGLTTANTLKVDADTRIDASGDGTGGHVTLWSEDDTLFAGRIIATGTTGDGGNAEVSGRRKLAYDGFTDLRTRDGATGTLLLDPYNVTISAAADSGTSGFAANASGATINTTTLQNALSTANVTVSTGASGAEAGDITVASTFGWFNNKLTLDAAGAIIITGAIGSSGASADLTLIASGAGGISGSGAIGVTGALTFDVRNAAASGTLSGRITQTASVVKLGAGSLTLAAVNNIYSGGTTINAGTLNIGPGLGLPLIGSITFGGGILQYYAGNSTDYSGLFSSAANQAIIIDTNGQNVTFGAALTSSGGSLTKLGTGTLTLAGANAYTGTTTISGGTLQVGNGGTIGTLGTGDVSNSAALTVNRSDALTLGNAVTGSGSLTKLGTGTLTLTGANTYTGTTTITGGTLQVGNGGTIGTLGTGAVGNNAALTFNRSDALSVANAISGTGSLTQAGTGTLTLNGTNSYTGMTNVSAGTVKAGSAAAFSTVARLNVLSPATLDLGGFNISTGAIAGNGTVTTTGGNAQLTFTGLTGDTGVGTVLSDGPAASGVLSVYLTSNWRLNFSRTNSFTGNLTGSTGGFTVSGAGSLNGGTYAGNVTLPLTYSSSANQTLSGLVSGLLVKDTSTSTLTLTGNNNATASTIISAGTLQIGNGGTTGTLNTGTTTVNSGGTLAFNRSNAVSASGIQGSGTAIIAQAGTGTTTLTNMNSGFAGSINVNSGTLQIGDGASVNALGQGTNQVTIATGAVLAFNRSDFGVSLGNLIQGGGAVTMVGTGTVALSNTNTYSGGTTVSAGTLKAGSGGAFGSVNSAMTVLANATLDLASRSVVIGSLSGAGTVTNSSAGTTSTLATGGSGTDATFSGTLQNGSSGNGVLALTKLGTGTQTLSGANTYNGATIVSGGTLKAGTTTALGSNSALNLSATGATLDLGGFSLAVGSLTGVTGSLVTNSGVSANAVLTTGSLSTSTTFAGNIQNGTSTTALAKTGSGTLTLSGANSYTGLTGVNAGVLKAGSTTAFSGSSATTIASGATLDLGGFSTSIGSLADAGTVTNNGTAATLNTGGDNSSTTFTGVIQNGSGTTGLTKSGTGTLTLTGANTYTGATTVSAGTVQIGNGTSGSLSASSAVSVASGATLALNRATGSTFANAVSNAGTINFQQTGTLTVSGVISGGGAVTQSGSGTTALTGTNSYTGTTAINTGTLQVNAGTLGTGSIVNNAALVFNRTDNTIIANSISGAGSLTKQGIGMVTLSGMNTYAGVTTVTGGTLAAGSTAAFGNNSAATVSAGATLDLAGNSLSLGSISGTGRITTTTAATLTVGSANDNPTFGGVMQDGSGALALTKVGTGKLSLSGANTFTGDTTIIDGILQLGTGSTSGTLGTGAVRNSAQLWFKRSDASLIVSNNISGTGLLWNEGTGTVTLSGMNSYTGGTTVNQGSLKAGSTSAFGSNSDINVVGGMTLDLAGYSNSIGTLTGDGTVTTSSGNATLTFTNANGGVYAVPTLLSDGANVSRLSIAVASTGRLMFSRQNLFTGDLIGNGNSGSFGVTSTGNLAGGNYAGAIGTYFFYESTRDQTLSGNLSGIRIEKNGGAALTLAGNNGQLTLAINAGNLELGSATALGAESYIVFGGGVLKYSPSNQADYSSYIAPVESQSISIDTNGQNVTFASPLTQEKASLTKIGSGTLTLAGANTYTGATFVNGGTLNLAGSLDVGSGTATTSVAANATLSGTGTIKATTLAHSGAGTLRLTGSNAVRVFTATGVVGAVTLNNAQSLTLGSIDSGSNAISVSTQAGTHIALAAGTVLSSTAANTAITLASSGNLFNRAGARALSAPNGRWLVYSATPVGNAFDGLDSGNTAVWNTANGSPISKSGNRYVFAYQPTVIFTSTDATKTYGVDATGAVAGAFTVSGIEAGISGAYSADTAANAYSGTPSVTSAGSAPTADVAGGPYGISVASGTLAPLNGYALGYASSGSLTIGKAALDVTVLGAVRSYDATDFRGGNGVSFSGFQNGETAAVLGGALSYGGTAQGASQAGSYVLTASGLTSGNYALSYTHGGLTISPALLKITGTGRRTTYNGGAQTNGFTTRGLFGSDTVSGVAGLASGTNAGTYSDNLGSATGSGLDNYTIDYVNGGLTIGKAVLTLIGASTTATYDGLSRSNAAATLSGVQGSDSFTITGHASGTAVGTYADALGLIANGGSLLSNYDLSITNGKLTLTPASLTITGTDRRTTYNGGTQTNGFTTRGLFGSDTVSGVAGLASGTNAGTYTDNLTGATGSGLGNYTITYAGGSLTIDRAPLTLTYTANPARSVYGSAVSSLTGTVSGIGFVGGEGVGSLTGSAVWNTTASASSNVGTYAIIGGGLASGNYAITQLQEAGNSSAYRIDPASLIIKANDAARHYDAMAYTGGNGISSFGFVNRDTLASLVGNLVYGGNAQGAADIGTYQITASGLTSINYVIDWRPGILLITPLNLETLPSLYKQPTVAPAWMAEPIELELGNLQHGEQCLAAPTDWKGQISIANCTAN